MEAETEPWRIPLLKIHNVESSAMAHKCGRAGRRRENHWDYRLSNLRVSEGSKEHVPVDGVKDSRQVRSENKKEEEQQFSNNVEEEAFLNADPTEHGNIIFYII